MQNYSIFNGDCLRVMKKLSDSSVDMVLCDLPYGMTKNKWDIIIPFDKLWEQYHRVCKTNAAVVLFCHQPFTSELITSNRKEFKYLWYWKKKKPVNFLNAKKQPLRDVEEIAVFYRAQPIYNPQMAVGKIHSRGGSSRDSTNYGAQPNRSKCFGYSDEYYPRTLLLNIKQNTINKTGHPTAKPIDLCEYLIKTYTHEGMTVLDNCMGCGTTGIACLNTGRKFIGIEKDETYFDIATKRIEEAQANITKK